jgi:hypothetical protein
MANTKPRPKTQREISRELQGEPYYRGNPNDTITQNNRAIKISQKGDKIKSFNVGIKDIDGAILYYLQNVIKPFVIQNGQRLDVPVIYGSPERWKSVQKDGYYKDKNGATMMPLIIFKRDNIEKVKNIANKLDANNPNNIRIIEKKYSSKNAYNKFNILTNRSPQKEYHIIIIPDYVTVNYSCIISTYYIEQLNGIVEAINYASDSYWGDPERYKFKTRINTIQTPTELVSDNNRTVKANFNIILDGYIIPDTIQKDLAGLKKIYSTTKIQFSTEAITNLNNIPTNPR